MVTGRGGNFSSGIAVGGFGVGDFLSAITANMMSPKTTALTGMTTILNANKTLSAFTKATALAFLQTRHDFDEVARLVADVELPLQNTVPAILHRAGRTREGEEVGAAGNAGTGA